MPLEVPIWVHMIVTSYLGSEIGPADAGRPFAEVWTKTHDGLYMASTWDRWINPDTGRAEAHPRAINDAAKLTAIARDHAAEGRNLRPWCVVKGLDPAAEGRLAGEMALAAAAGNLTGDAVMIIDLEPYYHGGPGNPQFWRSDTFSDGPARVQILCDSFLAVAPRGTLWVAGDVRAAHMAAVSYGAWAAHPAVSLHNPQTYYTIFDSDPNTSLERAIMHMDRAHALLATYGVEPGRIGQILPAEGDSAVLIGAFGHAHDAGEQKPSIWQRVNVPALTCDALNDAADPWAYVPPVVPPEPQPDPVGPNEEQRTRALAGLAAARIDINIAETAIGFI